MALVLDVPTLPDKKFDTIVLIQKDNHSQQQKLQRN